MTPSGVVPFVVASGERVSPVWNIDHTEFRSLVYRGSELADVTPWTVAVEAVSRYRHFVRTHDDTLVQVAGVEDVHRARRQGKLAVSFDLEGMDALNGDVRRRQRRRRQSGGDARHHCRSDHHQ